MKIIPSQNSSSLQREAGSLLGNGSEEDYSDDSHIFENPQIRLVMYIVYSVVFFFCFFGNLTVIFVTAFHHRMKSITKFCLCNLAIANLCVGIFCVYPNLFMYLYTRWILGSFMCKMYHFTNSLSHTASILILVVIAVERYLAILHPFKCRRLLTMHRLRLTIMGVWILSALICSPRLYYVETIRHPFKTGPTSFEVICVPTSNLFDFETADMIQFIVLFVAPLVIISILYTRLGLYLRRRDVSRGKLINPSPSCRVDQNPSVLRTNKRMRNPKLTIRQFCSGKSEVRQHKFVKSSNSIHRPTCRFAPPPVRRESTREVNRIRINVPRHHRGGGGPRWKSKTINIHHPHKVVVRMLITVVVTFAICNLPFHLRKIWQNYISDWVEEADWTELTAPITYLFMYANCAINPYLYGFMSKTFRRCCVEVVTCSVKQRRVLEVSGGTTSQRI